MWRWAALALVAVSFFAAVRWRGSWLMTVPAGLPWLNFSPWTGWLAFDEFDLLLLGTVAGLYARQAWCLARPSNDVPDAATQPALRGGWMDRLGTGLVLALAVTGLLALVRGLVDAGGFRFGWFDGYTDPLNSLRIFKGLLLALLLAWPIRMEVRRSAVQACSRLALGMGVGLACAGLAVLWERAAFPGLLAFGPVYRSTALFWEMHVGGGAVDAYLAMATPFAWLALVRSRRIPHQVFAALLILLAVYACLTTFSRGLYLAVLLPGLAMASAHAMRRWRAGGVGQPLPPPIAAFRVAGLGVLGILVLVLAGAALGPDSFMANRLGNTEKVWNSRLQHWQDALGLLRTRADWWLGLGMGRFPAHYAANVPGGEFPGLAVRGAPGDAAGGADGRDHVVIQGPRSRARLGGLYTLTQRVAIQPGARYDVRLDVRASARVRLVVEVCERHLLYDWHCHGTLLPARPSVKPWQSIMSSLSGPDFAAPSWYAPRLGMLTVAVLDPGGSADVGAVSLKGPGGRELLRNGDFADGLTHWFPAAQYYFLPWHADSLYLETLLERGFLGLSVVVALLVLAGGGLLSVARTCPLYAPCLMASLGGAMLTGLVSSLLDVPRIAFLFYLLVFFALQLAAAREVFPRMPEASEA